MSAIDVIVFACSYVVAFFAGMTINEWMHTRATLKRIRDRVGDGS